ncbi:Golgi apparatus membrane protein [Lachnellula subtilissima]|uniref:Golgi apparatus membrane protein TVP23 n=1 Tax=Lachnellula subtilissima TaxID=602034 RepID=A0A8H8RD48_9HELO|nr:Golgi apparatus membrane protein [Lachnellula subtilissima]
MEQNQPEGSLSWRLSSHPITLLWFLAFRISQLANNVYPPASLLVYLFGGILFTANHVLIFIITILLLAADFYYLKNIAGRRLVGLRWWNEVNPQTGDSHWVFESSDPSTKVINATDKRFFWMALYSQPLLWVALAVVAIFRFEVIWLTLVGTCISYHIPRLTTGWKEAGEGIHEIYCTDTMDNTVIALSLTVTNTLAFSRCDKFGQASNIAGSAWSSGGLAGNVATGLVGRFFLSGLSEYFIDG